MILTTEEINDIITRNCKMLNPVPRGDVIICCAEAAQAQLNKLKDAREDIAKRFNFEDKLTRATREINEKDSWAMTSLSEKGKWLEKADQILKLLWEK